MLSTNKGACFSHGTAVVVRRLDTTASSPQTLVTLILPFGPEWDRLGCCVTYPCFWGLFNPVTGPSWPILSGKGLGVLCLGLGVRDGSYLFHFYAFFSNMVFTCWVLMGSPRIDSVLCEVWFSFVEYLLGREHLGLCSSLVIYTM